eukprot:1161681-Pelagomonas_calceolata.AAC.23
MGLGKIAGGIRRENPLCAHAVDIDVEYMARIEQDRAKAMVCAPYKFVDMEENHMVPFQRQMKAHHLNIQGCTISFQGSNSGPLNLWRSPF